MHKVGWHLGNARPMDNSDWDILRAVPPASVTVVSGEAIGGDQIREILKISPQCHIFLRPYFPPSDKEQDFLNYLNGVKGLIAPENWEMIPAGQRHLQIFNEQNMPHTAPIDHPTDQWEGFGPSLEAMERFNRWFCLAYDQLKAVNPTWKIGFSPLTPGNRDAYFRTDPQNVPYYMHGPEAAKDDPSAEEIRAAIKSGPCYQALKKADEYLAHIYVINDAEHQMTEIWAGLRFVQYARFFPKPMNIWITELGIGGHESNWTRWFQLLDNYPEVRGTGIWRLGYEVRSAGEALVKELKNYVSLLPPAPTASFEVSATSGPAPFTVQFSDKTAGSVRQWRWAFGDGGLSSQQHPAYTYKKPGSYTVTLKAYGPGGESIKKMASLVTAVSAVPPPVAAFAAQPTSGQAPLTVHLTDQSTGEVTAWQWDFGDGHTESGRNPSHTYGAPGDYTVALTVSGPGGSNVKRLNNLITVSAAPIKPVAGFVVSPSRGPAPLTVQFTDQSTGQISLWQWDLGDGHTSNLQHPQHTYEVMGHYAVSLTVSGPAGSASETKPGLVTVDRRISVDVGPGDDEVHFDTAEEAIRNKAWNTMAIAYNPQAGFPRYARQHGLGAPLTGETDVAFGGAAFRLQGFVGGIVFCEVGKWDRVGHIEW
ncbi:MAG: PKD domain-containing protein [Chloroflexota bacterium]